MGAFFCVLCFIEIVLLAGTPNAFGSSSGTPAPSPFGGGSSGFGAPSALGGGGVFGAPAQSAPVPAKVVSINVLKYFLYLFIFVRRSL